MSILEVNQLDGVGLDERNDERLLYLFLITWIGKMRIAISSC